MRATGRSRSRSLIEEELSATRETKTIELKKDVLAMANSGGLVWPRYPISGGDPRPQPPICHLRS